MLEWYTRTIYDYLAVGAGVIVLMLVLNKVLRRLGVGREAATGYSLILPWILGFLVWNLGPFAASLYLSVTDYNGVQTPGFVGLDNYVRMFTDDRNFWPVLRFTLLYSVFNVPIGLVGALLTAVLLNQNVRGLGAWRTIYYLPAVLPAAATALLWRWMFASNGIINFFLEPVLDLFDIAPPAWFSDRELVLPSYIIMALWGVFGASTVILLAGLKGVPRDLYEAATVDGAGRVRQFFNVTIPMISPTLFYVLIMGVIASLQTFTVAFFIETPRRAGTFMNVFIYREAFEFNRFGYASALGWVTLLIILCFTLLVFKSSPAWVHYEGDKAG